MRRGAATLVVAAVATIVAVGLLEVLARVFFPGFDPSGRIAFTHAVGDRLVLAPPNVDLRQRKNTGDYDVAVRINRHGLRDPRDIAEAAADDIVVVGDSFAWGWGVATGRRFSDLLEPLTGRRVFNLSAPADLDGYRDLLDHARALGARTGQIVLALCMENDLGDYDAPDEPSGHGMRWDWRGWLEHHSAAYLLFAAVVHQTPPLRAVAVALGLVTPNLAGIPRHTFSRAVVESSAQRVAGLARDRRLLVVVIPSRALWVGANRDVEDQVHVAFVAALARAGLDVLDMRPLLESDGAPLSHHFVNDGHWNEAGHRLAAGAIAARLARP
ncbi:MAG: hypothetical protein KIT25_17655 [Enhydrobacter sp.]|nr:MAG: hypothetical protein KIT25_17655 [Enhydrobacter sp.]